MKRKYRIVEITLRDSITYSIQYRDIWWSYKWENLYRNLASIAEADEIMNRYTSWTNPETKTRIIKVYES